MNESLVTGGGAGNGNEVRVLSRGALTEGKEDGLGTSAAHDRRTGDVDIGGGAAVVAALGDVCCVARR